MARQSKDEQIQAGTEAADLQGKVRPKGKGKTKIKYYHLLGKTLIKLQESWVFMSEG